MKDLKELAWNVDEPAYRADPAYSYSLIATFAREGCSCIPYIREKRPMTGALRKGSLVDCLLTEPETFDARFKVGTFTRPSDKIAAIVDDLYALKGDTCLSLEDIPKEDRLAALDAAQYQMKYKETTRLASLMDGNFYYRSLILGKDKTLVSQEEYDNAVACVDELKTNPYTSWIFTIDKLPGFKTYSQLKFKTKWMAYPPVRCMFDLIVVNYNDRTIKPMDYKTSGHPEKDFKDSFMTWLYYLQATMYSQILQKILAQDEYFKDFKILPFDFIVINEITRSPMIWRFENNLYPGDFVTQYGTRYKGWRTLLGDMEWHINKSQYKYSREVENNHGVMILDTLVPEYPLMTK